MSDWVTTIIGTPYLVVPIVAWLWSLAKLPKVQWDKVASGVLMVFSAQFLNALAGVFAPYAGWGPALQALFSFFGIVSNVLGLAIIGFYLLVDALMMWKAP